MINSLSEFFSGPSKSGEDPKNYTKWPSLFWPPIPLIKVTLEDRREILKFTILWTIIFFTVIYGLAGIWAWVVFYRHRWSFLIPIGFIAVALLTGSVGGTIIGLVLAAIYTSGSFQTSVWIPFLWGLIQALILLMGCYSTITTIL